MSDTATEASPPSRANTRELRLRVQSGFSAGEIRRLLEAWGAAPEELEGDVGTLAHHLVRIGDKRFGVPEMARRFRAEKPLLEWPEEDWGSDKWAGKGPGIDVETTIVDVPVPPEKTVIEAVPEEAAPPAEEPESIKAPESVKAPPPPSTKNPMIFLEPEAMRAKPARQGIDPKWLAIGGGALVVVVGLAFVAGLAWRRDDAAPEAAPQAKPDGPTLMGARAAGFLDQSLLSVAALCELDVDGAPTREVLIVAQESCGPQKPGPSRRRPELGDEPAPRPDEPTRVRPRAAPEPEPKRNDNPAPAPAAGGGKGSCTKSCMRVQDECLGACGDEPKDAKLYDAFQQCTSKCYTGSARCRTSCP